MRIGWIRTFALAGGLAMAASSHCAAAATTYQGGGWYSGSSWSGGNVPTLADDVIIPTGYHPELGEGTAYANTVTLQGNATITIYDTILEIDGGGGGNTVSSVNAANGVKLDDAVATLKLTGNQTWQGAGSVQLNNTTALINISSGATWTVQLASVHGLGSIGAISGTATLKLDNGADVIADYEGSGLELAADLILDDTSSGNLWAAIPTPGNPAGVLLFKRAASNLLGQLKCEDDGVLEFYQPVATTGAVTCANGVLTINADLTTTGLFTYNEGVIAVLHDVDFVYSTYTSHNCPNPGSGSGPYTLSGPAGSGVTTVTCP